MSSYVPDLTGLAWDNYVTTYHRVIFRAAQKLLFDIPIHHNERLEVTQLGTTPAPMEYGTDWIVLPEDIDTDATSVAKTIDPSFSGTLLKSITVIKAYAGAEYPVQVKFNQLFADYLNYAAINRERELEVTPTLIGNMLAQVEYLQQMVLNPSGLYSPQSSHVKILDEAPHGDSDDHLIVDERHDVDSLHNVRFIRPVYGAFFKDSVTVTNVLSGEVLVEDVDYKIIELDLVKTSVTANVSGVYRTIEIKKTIVGELGINYRAYGGTADMVSIRRLHDRLWAMEDYLSKTSHITPATLPAEPSIVVMRNKIQELEGQMRLLLQNGLPTYGDVSTGSAVLKKVTAPDAGLHWWTIGTLYRVNGSSDDVLADVMKFRIKSLYTKMMFEASVNVNVSDPDVQRVIVSCDNSNIPKDTLARLTPKLRILEVLNGGIYSGVVLQLGMKLNTGVLQETFAVEDMSGRESCWKLTTFHAESTPPEDTGVLMPNGVTVWASNTSGHLVDEATIPFKDGLNVLTSTANVPLNLDETRVELDQVTQSVGVISLSAVRGFEHELMMNVGDPDEATLRVLGWLGSGDDEGKNWFSSTTFVFGASQYQLQARLFLDEADGNYKISYLVTQIGDGPIATINLMATKLIF